MSYLPQEVRDGLEAARVSRLKTRSRMRVRAGGHEFVILRHWDTGFALAAEDAASLPGRVDLYDGARHLCQALILASTEEGGERVFEFKYATPVADAAPPADFARDPDAPVALLPPA
ncbi:MAG: hypothetical protein V2I65_10480 [Paracoccaceae bacterium]|jgi:hypothetical protein|nr:hypothetical protein [Paracoccaceae bacterium]